MATHRYSAPRHIALKIVKNATKRPKSAANWSRGLFSNRKSGEGLPWPLRFAAAMHSRAADGCSGLPPPGIGPGRILLCRLSAVGQNVVAGLFVGSPLLPARPGKIFSSGVEFLFDTLQAAVRLQLAWLIPVIGLGHSPNNKSHPKTT